MKGNKIRARDLFTMADTNNSKSISLSELRNLIFTIWLPLETIMKMMYMKMATQKSTGIGLLIMPPLLDDMPRSR